MPSGCSTTTKVRSRLRSFGFRAAELGGLFARRGAQLASLGIAKDAEPRLCFRDGCRGIDRQADSCVCVLGAEGQRQEGGYDTGGEAVGTEFHRIPPADKTKDPCREF